jgi:phosphopantothenoylcysteine decarboxylase/phosphopantothenate--cysteine ligase
MKVVVTAGPTREHVDPVRYLSNESSGRMGFAIAAAAAAAGHAVTLIAGPVALPTPRGLRRVDVVSAREMFAATLRAFRSADALFMAAAVCDFRPSRRLAGKWRAKERAGASTRLTLVRNPDILAACGRQRGADPKLVVGFALETSSGIRRARRKLTRKGADFIVLNDERALNAPRASVLILGGDGSVRRLENRTKVRIARELVGLLGRR